MQIFAHNGMLLCLCKYNVQTGIVSMLVSGDHHAVCAVLRKSLLYLSFKALQRR